MKNPHNHNEMNINRDRRSFIGGLTAGVVGAGMFGLQDVSHAAAESFSIRPHRRLVPRTGPGRVSFVTGTERREAIGRALAPLRDEVADSIGDRQVVIKVNIGGVQPGFENCTTHVDQVRAILDFLKPIHDGTVIIAEGTANHPYSIRTCYTALGYDDLVDEFDVALVDTNDLSATTHFIRSPLHHPQAINIMDMFLDEDVYMISATMLKVHGAVVATLCQKNLTMGSPKHHYTHVDDPKKNEKQKMHSGGSRGLSYNLFRIASLGVVADLGVLDGIYGAEGEGPWNAVPIKHGVALASTDWLACDRLGVELMGIDYAADMKYLQWCSEAQMGSDDLERNTIIGPDWRPHILKYKLKSNIASQRQWIREDYQR
jgi:uncharacterized protein (DUF362 family)